MLKNLPFDEPNGEIVEKLVEALHKAYEDALKTEIKRLTKEGKETQIFKTKFVWAIEPVTKKILVGPDLRNTGSKVVDMNAPEISTEEIEKGFEK